jgi:hypothetical protein
MRVGRAFLWLAGAFVVAIVATSARSQVRTIVGGAAKASPSAMFDATQTGKRPTVVIPLSNLGIADWDFLNPRRPKAIPVGADLEFRNGTADRTITVTLPVSFNLSEPALLYPVSSKLGSVRAGVRYGIVALNSDRAQALAVLNEPTSAKIDAIVDKSAYRALVTTSDRIFELMSLREALRTPAPGANVDDLVERAHKTAEAYGINCCPVATALPVQTPAVPDQSGDAATALIAKQFGYERTLAESLPAGTIKPEIAKTATAIPPYNDGWPRLVAGSEELGSAALQRKKVDDAIAHLDRTVACLSGTCGAETQCGSACSQNAALLKDFVAAVEKQTGKIGQDLQAAKANAAAASARAAKWKTVEEKARLDAEVVDLQKYVLALTTLADALKKASDSIGLQSKSDPVFLLAGRIGAATLADCATANGKLSCSATQTANPGQSVVFDHVILTIEPKQILQAKVKFFDETQTPSNPTAYLIEEGQTPDDRPPEGSFALTAALGGVYEPFVSKRTAAFGIPNCAALCPAFPLDSQHDAHYKTSGRMDVTRTLSYFADANLSLKFQAGDFGGNPDTTTKFSASQYIFKAYSQNGFIFQFGRFDFAVPSSGISINESGEGFSLSYLNYSGAWEVKRESNAFTPDNENRDSYAAIFSAKNLPLSSSFARTFDLIAVYGNDHKKDTTVPVSVDANGDPVQLVTRAAHKYLSYGGELFYAVPPASVQGSIAGYRATRNAQTAGGDCSNANLICDGRGAVGLLTVTKAFINQAKQSADRLFNLYVGLGTGDNAKTPGMNEAYIGETPAFAPDLIFMSRLSGSVSAKDPLTPDSMGTSMIENGPLGLGSGLSGKRYIGLQYIDNVFSPLEMFATAVFRIPKTDVKSRSTTITLNDYHLREPFRGSKTAGREIDIQFAAESPKNVKVSVGGGYFFPGSAMKGIIRKNTWLLQSNISISL